MANQTFIWTALPNGIRNGKYLRLSVVLTPRLTASGLKPKLGDKGFEDIADWANTVNGLEFQVQFANGPTYDAQKVSPPADPELWNALFPSDTYVRSYKAEQSTSTVVSYPVRNLLGYVSDRYRKLALAYPTRLPPASKLLDPEYFGEIRLGGGLTTQVKRLQAETRQEQAAMVAQAMAAVQAARRAASTPRRDREYGPITPPPEASAGDRDTSPLPTGLAEHIRDTIDDNRRQVGEAISRGLGEFGQTDPSAPLPFEKPPTRPDQELPEELPIYFPIDDTPNPLRDFLKAGLFYLGLTPEFSGDPEDREIQPMPMLPEFDFHQMVSVLGDHPTLMREVGLIIDLEVELTADVPTSSLCRVTPNWETSRAENISPWTYYEINRIAGTFTPRQRPSNPEVQEGLLRLRDTTAFSLIQTDPDSAAIGLLDRINSLDPEDEEAGVPTLRSNGIGVARTGAGILLLQSFVTSNVHNETLASNPEKLAFYAEDLIQGYRPDIWWERPGKAARWYSLTARKGTYEFLRPGRTEEVQDEGWVSLAATSGVSSASTDLHLHEMMFNWTGWSLVVPPVEPGDEETEGQDDSTESEPLTAMQLRSEFSVPDGSLPRLRFGHTYRIRARAVDLAGNSLPFTPDLIAPTIEDEPGASNPITYRRLEPVGSPLVYAPGVDWDPPEKREADDKDPRLEKGETVQRLMIRSYDGEQSTGSREISYRHLAPPVGSVKLAETHGMFDTDEGFDTALYEDALERSTKPDTYFQRYLISVGEEGPKAADVPYCPDPMAKYIHFKFRRLPYAETFVKSYPLYVGGKSWPDVQTIVFRIDGDTEGKEGKLDPNRDIDWTEESHTLTVHLPLYEQYEVRVSSGFEESDLDLFYLWHLMSEDPDADTTRLRELARTGQHWMLTPGTTLTLVHASQKPKFGPEFITAMAHRQKGETAAILGGQVKVHARSTQAIQVFASWQETIDDESLDEPTTSAFSGFAFQEGIRSQDYARADKETGECTLEVYDRHDWGDTRYRKVRYRAVGISRFTQYFDHERDERIKDDPNAFKLAGPEFEVDVLATAPPDAPRVEYIVPTFGWEKPKDKEDGQIVSMRTGGGLRVYIKRPWFSSGEGELLGVILSDSLEDGKVPEKQRHYVTQWGKDPLWEANAPDPAPRIEHFRNAAAAQRGIEMEDGTKVAVVGYEVQYDKERKLWYADVEMDVGKAYFPFVRLGLARYQPKAVDGCHLSDIILTDFLQVVPDRATSIRYASQDEDWRVLQVTVSGETYDRGPVGPAVVEVTAETTTEEGETLQWEPYSSATTTLKRQRNVWRGTVTLPADKRCRLIISEYEQYVADGGQVQRRLVFTDVLEV